MLAKLALNVVAALFVGFTAKNYSWTALITGKFLGELPLNIPGSSTGFLVWYWLVEFPSSRLGYTYLMLGVMLPMYDTTSALPVGAMLLNPAIAAQLFDVFITL
jgi:ATP-binding cassette subfamily G (WHITE) protein 2 (SNQ2)